jgi:FG-GAP-like repeat/Astacin (Peptidase family M12A)
MNRFVLAAAGSMALSLGCSPGASDGPQTPRQGAPEDDAKNDYIASKRLWRPSTISVCWEPSEEDWSAQHEWVRDAAESTWGTVANVRFTGWGTCSSRDSGIHIRVQDASPYTLGLGNELDGMANGMSLNFTFQNWSQGCQSTQEFCVRAGAAHEFGHALGFAHEQNRPDTPDSCTLATPTAGGDTSIGGWDLDSIMNYCNPRWTGDGKLSAGDVVAARAAYGAPAGLVTVARNVGARFEPSRDVATTELGAKRALGDVDGDGDADLVSLEEGTWRVAIATSGGFSESTAWGRSAGGTRELPLLGDVDGDGDADAVTVSAGGTWSVAFSDRSSFGQSQWWGELSFGYGRAMLADVNGDRRLDAVVADTSGAWRVALATEGSLSIEAEWASNVGQNAADFFAADVDGDGKADALAASSSGGRWTVALSTGEAFGPARQWASGHGAAASGRFVADADGDGLADAIVYERAHGAWWVASSSGNGFATDVGAGTSIAPSLLDIQPTVLVGDTDGDGLADVVVSY